jgi:glycosyltransferase involved in cell wall biosynthesis
MAELISLRPDLACLRKVYYFHENQLTYPARNEEAAKSAGQRDWSLSWGQIVSCLVADTILFNSHYNMKSFLGGIPRLLSKVPKNTRPRGIVARIEAKSHVAFFPLHINPSVPLADGEAPHLSASSALLAKNVPSGKSVEPILHIVWAHRWEHDKNPEMLFRVLLELKEKGLLFVVSILGESFSESPDVFRVARERLGAEYIRHWGFLTSRREYLSVLLSADVAVSTADHEFYGVSTLEAAWQGCYPLCPNRLVYPDFFPKECLYNTERQLFRKLKNFCRYPQRVHSSVKELLRGIKLERFHWTTLKKAYECHLFPTDEVIETARDGQRKVLDHRGPTCVKSAASKKRKRV